MAIELAPIPANVLVQDGERAALNAVCVYTRKGSLPPQNVTRQQLIEDVLARGYTKRSATMRGDRVMSLKLENPTTGQYYRFQKNGEISYAERRLQQVLATEGSETKPNAALHPIRRIDEGWRVGERVTQQIRGSDNRSHTVVGEVFINSAQRWRVRVVETDNAPGLRVGNSFPATAAWQRKAVVQSPSEIVAPAPSEVVHGHESNGVEFFSVDVGAPKNKLLITQTLRARDREWIAYHFEPGYAVQSVVFVGAEARAAALRWFDAQRGLRAGQPGSVSAEVAATAAVGAPAATTATQAAEPEEAAPAAIAAPVSQPAPEAATPAAVPFEQLPLRVRRAANLMSENLITRLRKEEHFQRRSREEQNRMVEPYRPDRQVPNAQLLIEAIDGKNVGWLLERNNGMWPSLWRAFEADTGLKLPKTQKGIGESLRDWAGAELYDAAVAQRDAQRAAESERVREREARTAFLSAKSRANMVSVLWDGRQMRGDEFIDARLAEGWTVARMGSGPVPKYHLIGAGGRAIRLPSSELTTYARLKSAENEKAAAAPARAEPAVGAAVELRPSIGGLVRGVVIRVTRLTETTTRVRVVHVEGAAGQQFARGASVPYAPEWEEIGAERSTAAEAQSVSVGEAPRVGRWTLALDQEAFSGLTTVAFLDLPANGGTAAATLLSCADDPNGPEAFAVRLPDGTYVPNPQRPGEALPQWESYEAAAAAAEKVIDENRRAAFEILRTTLRKRVLDAAEPFLANSTDEARRVTLRAEAGRVFGQHLADAARDKTLTGDTARFFNATTAQDFADETLAHWHELQQQRVQAERPAGLVDPVAPAAEPLRVAEYVDAGEVAGRWPLVLAEARRMRDATPNGVHYYAEAAGQAGEDFFLLREKGHSDDDITRAAEFLRDNQKATSIRFVDVEKAAAIAQQAQAAAPSVELFKGVAVNKPARDLTEAELATVLAPDPAAIARRNADLGRVSRDPRFLSSIYTNAVTFDGHLAALHARSGAIFSEAGAWIEQTAAMLRAENNAISAPASYQTAYYLHYAISTGQFSPILHPNNKASRAVFEKITGLKLPKTLRDTVDVVRGVSPDVKAKVPKFAEPLAQQWETAAAKAGLGDRAPMPAGLLERAANLQPVVTQLADKTELRAVTALQTTEFLQATAEAELRKPVPQQAPQPAQEQTPAVEPAPASAGVDSEQVSAAFAGEMVREMGVDSEEGAGLAEAAGAASIAEAIQAGAARIDAGKLPDVMSLVDHHTSAGPVRSVVVGGEGDALTVLPLQAYLDGEEVAPVSAAVGEVTIPKDVQKFGRPDGECLAAIAAAADRAKAGIGAEDPEMDSLMALGNAAVNGRMDEVMRLLGDSGVALTLGGPVEGFRHEAASIAARKARERKPEESNWYFGRGERVSPRSVEARTAANLAAVRLLKKLSGENRLSTPEEKAVLAQFSGWGSMKGIFDDQQSETYANIRKEYDGAGGKTYGFDPKTGRYGEREVSFKEYCTEASYREEAFKWHQRWGKAHTELKGLLSEEEFMRAGLSALNAHFTEESVCHRMWDIAKQLGFQGGTVLEPAIGSGRVVSAMPPEFREKCRVVGVEKDQFTAQLTKQLLPEAKVYAEGFETAPVKNASADLVITNVPFSDTKVGDSGLNLHNYFLSQSMAKLKPGGLAIVITSAHTLDSSADQRAKLTDRMELVGSFRLPNDAFKSSSGTDVVTDMLFLRKPAQHLTPAGETFSAVLPVAVPKDQLPQLEENHIVAEDEIPTRALVNEYYIRHPEHVFGVHSLRGSMYGRGTAPQYTVAPASKAEQSLDDRLGAAIAQLTPVENSSMARQQALTDEELTAVRLAALKEEKVGAVVERDGKLFRVDDSRELVPWEAPAGRADPAARRDAEAMASSYVQLRTAFIVLITADLSPVTTDEESAKLRKELKARYDDFRREYGPLNEPRTRRSLKEVVGGDPDFYTVMALENVRVERQNRKRVLLCDPAPIFQQRTLFPSQAPQAAATVDEAALLSIAELGRLDVAYMARLLKREGDAGAETTRTEAVREGIAFLDPISGALEYKEQYLTGDVLTKLAEARQAAIDDPEFARNVAALEKAAPLTIPFEETRPSISSAWLPAETVTKFAQKKFELHDRSRMVYDPDSGWRPMGVVGNKSWSSAFYFSTELQRQFGSASMGYLDVLEAALRGKVPPIYKEVDTGGEHPKRVFDEVATREIEQRVDTIRAMFLEWLAAPEQADERARVEKKYNESFNRVVLARWDGSRLRFPGLARGSFEPMKHQRDMVMRGLLMLRGIAAHGVGFGKSLEIVLIAMEAKRLGLASKPIVVCDNANYEQMVATTRQCYPQARILHAEDGDLSPDKREEFKARMASGDYDLILMSRSQFGRIRVSPEREIAYLLADLKQFDKTVDGESRMVRQQLKAKEKALAKAEERLEKLRAKGGAGLSWEQLGVDLLLVDESHRHKKIGLNTRFDSIKGIDTAVSQRGLDLMLKAQFIQEKRGQGRGAIGFTGTPCSNTMAEYWTGVKIFDPMNLKAFNVETFDQFITSFTQTENSLEMNEANGRWRVVERLKKFVNGREFIRFISATYDVRMDSTELGLKRPGHEKGNIELGSCSLTWLVHAGKQEIAAIYKQWEDLEPKERAAIGWVPLVLMQLNIALSIDPRLVDPHVKVGKDALINGIADEIARVYREKNKPGAECTHTQVVFCDRRNTIAGKIKLRLGGAGAADDYAKEVLDTFKVDETHGLEVDTSNVLVVEDDEDETEAPAEKAGKAEKAEKPVKQKAEPKPGFDSFNLWEELRDLLVARGVPREKVALVSDARNKSDKLDMLERMNTGELAVLVGSSDTLGIGSNFQRRLYMCHNIDPARTMTPDAMEQRFGRILRQGNTHPFVRVACYGMENTVIPAIYGRIQTKGAFAKQAFTKGVGVEFEETSDLRTEEMRAMLLTDKRAMDRQMLNEQIRDMKLDEEAAARRASTIRQQVDNLNFSIRFVKEKMLPTAIAVRDWFRANVKPPRDRWNVKLVFATSQLTNKETEALKKVGLTATKAGVVEFEADAEKGHDILEKIVEAWKAEPETTFRRLGQLELNGCPMRLEMVRYGDGRRICGSVPDPTQPVNKDGIKPTFGSGLFMSIDKLVDTIDGVLDKAESEVTRKEQDLRQHEAELAKASAMLESLPKADNTARKAVEEKLRALEADMAANPFAGDVPPPRNAPRCVMKFDAGARASAADAAVEKQATASEPVLETAGVGAELTMPAATLTAASEKSPKAEKGGKAAKPAETAKRRR